MDAWLSGRAVSCSCSHCAASCDHLTVLLAVTIWLCCCLAVLLVVAVWPCCQLCCYLGCLLAYEFRSPHHDLWFGVETKVLGSPKVNDLQVLAISLLQDNILWLHKNRKMSLSFCVSTVTFRSKWTIFFLWQKSRAESICFR